jgi:hypothetical protein
MSTHVEVAIGPRGCAGCLITILAIIGIWAVCFGVTIGGKHHGLSCSRDKGVVIDMP